MISEQSLFQKGWSHQLESNIQQLNQIKAKSSHHILSFFRRGKQKDTREDVLDDQLTRITQQKDAMHYKYDQERKKNVINRREMTSKLIAFKAPTKERNISKSHILTYKKHLPTLPAKISPSKEVSMLLQNNQVHDDRLRSGICNTINLWENTSTKVKSRHYAEMFRKEQ